MLVSAGLTMIRIVMSKSALFPLCLTVALILQKQRIVGLVRVEKNIKKENMWQLLSLGMSYSLDCKCALSQLYSSDVSESYL